MVSVYEYNGMNRCKLCVAPVLVGKNRRQLANPASERCRGVLIDLACECRLSARDAKKEIESGYLCRKCFDEIAQYLALQEKVGSPKETYITVEEILTQNVPDLDEAVFDYVCGVLESPDDFNSSEDVYEAVGSVLLDSSQDPTDEEGIRDLCALLLGALKGDDDYESFEESNGNEKKLLDAPIYLGDRFKIDNSALKETNFWMMQPISKSFVDKKRLEKADAKLKLKQDKRALQEKNDKQKDCAARKGPAPKRRAALTPIEVGSPAQMVAMDFLGPLVETDEGNRYILVVGDHFTKYMSAYALPNQEAKTVARILVEEHFCQYGFPEQLHSDQGPQFESEVIAEMCKTMGIHKTRTTPYHPACNGEIERFNKTLCDILATALDGCHFTWDRHVKLACFAYNTSVHASTGYTPFYLMHGYDSRLPVDILCGTFQQDDMSHCEYVANLQKRLGHVFEKIHGEKFNTGDLVWLWNPAVPRKKGYNCKKLHRVWQGPFEVIKRLSDVTYRIQHTAKRRQRQVVHFDRLKPCNPDVRLHKVTQPVNEGPMDNHGAMSSTDDADTEDDGEVPMSVSNTKEQEAEEQSVEVDELEDAPSLMMMEVVPSSPQTGGTRDEAESSRGTPSLMDLYRKRVHTNMTKIRNMMSDIAHASHHLEFLKRAEGTGMLPRGLTVEPRMMLVFADETTSAEWKEQTKQNTLGYMKVAIRHYEKTISDRTATIDMTQTDTVTMLNDTRPKERS
eukprot:Em0008g724a